MPTFAPDDTRPLDSPAKPQEAPSQKQRREWVAERLRARILEGDLRPGAWLRQEKLAQDFGLSQTPVREALKQLASEGLVEHVPYRGIRVVELGPGDVRDLYECRAFIEGMAARSAAELIGDQDLAELRAIFELMQKRLGPRHIAEYRELNRRFHTIIFNASGRSFLVRTLAQLWSAFPSMMWSNFAQTAPAPLPGRDKTDVAEHAAILEALEAHDSDAAEQAIRRHVNNAKELLLNALEQAGAARQSSPGDPA